MARFLRHTACSHCGSSDANAVYDDLSTHCFSCGWHVGTKKLPHEIKVQEAHSHIDLPDDLSTDYSREAIEWIRSYDITVEELLKHNVKWSDKRGQLIFLFEAHDRRDLGLMQARNFAPWAGKRYTNTGDVNRVFPLFAKSSSPTTLVIVEDIISAIKVNRVCSSLPLLGSHLSLPKALMIRDRGFKNILVWLDSDKYRTAMNIKEQLTLIGLKSEVNLTDLDPKLYNENFIRDALDKLDDIQYVLTYEDDY